MDKPRPQFTYSTEGMLHIETSLDDGYRIGNETPEILEKVIEEKQKFVQLVGEKRGVVLAESNGIVSINIDIEKRFRDSFHNRGDPDISEFLRQINYILPYHPEDAIDRVYSLEFLHELGALGVINHHFQRWLNIGGLTEDTARHSAIAMALPFGNDITRRAKKGFDYFEDDRGQMATAYSSRIVVAKEEFKLWKSEVIDDAHVEQTGKIVWSNVNISTLGNCACWGATGEEREQVSIKPPSKRLYEMTPHNVDYARASLSLMLGMGALTYQAAQYDGKEDVLANAEWGEPRVLSNMKPKSL